MQDYRVKGSIQVAEYFDEFVTQQKWGYYIHRPLSSYLNFVIDAGCMISKIIEPTLSPEGVAILGEAERNRHVPGFIVIRAIKR